MKIKVNGEVREVDVDPDTPLLWVLRDELDLTGTKYGCGIAQCGACTVHMNGVAIRSCITAIDAVGDAEITTIDGIESNIAKAVQAAWVTHDVPQCGYCQSGQIMSATALLSRKPEPTDRDIDEAMSGNICRCGTYNRIRDAIHDASKRLTSRQAMGEVK